MGSLSKTTQVNMHGRKDRGVSPTPLEGIEGKERFKIKGWTKKKEEESTSLSRKEDGRFDHSVGRGEVKWEGGVTRRKRLNTTNGGRGLTMANRARSLTAIAIRSKRVQT